MEKSVDRSPPGPARAAGAAAPVRRIVGFLARFALVYALLMAPWPGWIGAYGKLYAATAQLLFGANDPNRNVSIRYVPMSEGMSRSGWDQDTAVRLRIRGHSVGMRDEQRFSTGRSSRYTGWVPTAFAVALVLATPVSRRRRIRALPWAVLLASGFSLAMLELWIQGWFYAQECIALAGLSDDYLARAKLMAALLQTSVDMGPYYVTPVFIWLAVMLRRRDLEPLLALARAASVPAEAS